MTTGVPAVYILTNRTHRVLYTGVTSDLAKRVFQHQTGVSTSSFTARYNVNRLVHYEVVEDMTEAIRRVKQIKGWVRRKKAALIERNNPSWQDLWDDICQ